MLIKFLKCVVGIYSQHAIKKGTNNEVEKATRSEICSSRCSDRGVERERESAFYAARIILICASPKNEMNKGKKYI